MLEMLIMEYEKLINFYLKNNHMIFSKNKAKYQSILN